MTRGCPYRCSFCDIPIRYGDYPRSKKIEQVINEIRALSELGYDSVFIVDDNFSGNKTYAKALLRRIAALLPSLPTRIYFYTQATLDVANDDELLELFRDAGFLRLFIGIETEDKTKLRALNKKHQIDIDIYRAVEKIKSYGITVWAGIMLGLEDDNPSSFDRQLEFIQKANFIPVQVGLLQAIPDTPLYKRACEGNRVLSLPSIYGLTAISEEELTAATNMMPQKMGVEELEKNFARILRKMFSPETFSAKMMQYISSDTRSLMSSLPVLNLKTLMVVLRMFSFYLFRADRKTRKMFLHVLKVLLSYKLRNLNETLFHLMIYKHMQTHYYKIAEICESKR